MDLDLLDTGLGLGLAFSWLESKDMSGDGLVISCMADEGKLIGVHEGGEGQGMYKAGKGLVQTRREWLDLT